MDGILNGKEMDTQEIRRWIENHMPDIVKDLTRICCIRSVAEVDAAENPPYGKGCREVLEEMLHIGEENGFAVHNYDNYVGKICYNSRENKDSIGIWAHLDVVEEGGTGTTSPMYPQ